MLGRRGLLLGGLLGLAGCYDGGRPMNPPSSEASGGGASPGTATRVGYGDDPSQYAELWNPQGASRGTVVVIHGGFWKAQYDASLGRPLAAALAEQGWAAWNLEYRRVGNGGGFPETLDDVAAGIDALAGQRGLDLSTVVTLGHSAGGHLAVWAAARRRFERWAAGEVEVTGAVSQAGVLDLAAAHDAALGGGAVSRLMGAAPGDPSYDLADPSRQLPLDVPVWCFHARDDDMVPFGQSESYVERSTAAGGTAELVEVTGGHFGVIDPTSPAWAAIVEHLDTLGR
jgi:acetyl esterase/lipase